MPDTLLSMAGYSQFCTVARGAEVLGERWTPLVVRELLCGSTRFNDLRRGVPRMSPTLLAQRLRKLEDTGVVRRVRTAGGWEYQLTPAGEELRPIVEQIGHWGARWIGRRLEPGQLDAGFLMWDIRRFVRLDEFPASRRVVIHFLLRDARPRERRWWLVVENGVADLCRDDPGHELTVIVEATVRALTEIWTGDAEARVELAAGRVRVIGPDREARRLWAWLGRSLFAPSRAEALTAVLASRPQARKRSRMRISSSIVVGALAILIAHPSAQVPKPGTLTGTLTIKTKGATTAVLGKNPDKKQGDFMFCISQERDAPQMIDFNGPARVIYQPAPALDLPPGITIEGPEMVEPTLAVIARDGQAWLFVRKGQASLLPASDPAFAKAKTVQVRGLTRSDWARKYGPRGGIGLEGCLSPGGN